MRPSGICRRDRLEHVGELLPHRGERGAHVTGRDAVDAHRRARTRARRSWSARSRPPSPRSTRPRCGSASEPETDALLTIAPRPASSMIGTTARMPLNVPVRFTSISRCHSLSSTVCSGRRSPEPALLNEHVEPAGRVGDRAARRPSTRRRRARRPCGRRRRPPARPVRAPRRRGRARRPTRPRPRTATAVARPMPDAPPGDDRDLPVELTHGRRRYSVVTRAERERPPRRGRTRRPGRASPGR